MDKNSVIGFVLIAIVLFGFSFIQSKRAREFQALQAQQDSIALANRISQVVDQVPVSGADTTLTVADLAPRPSIYKDSLLETAASAEERIIALENDNLRVEFSTKGAKPYSVLVKDFYNYDSTALYIFKPENCEYNISIYTGEFIRTDDFVFDVYSQTDSSVTMRLPFAGGGCIEQRWTLHNDSYRVDNQLSFLGMTGIIPRNVSSFDLDFNVTVPRMEKGYKNESQYSKLDYYLEGEKKPVEIGRGRSGSKRIDSKVSWFAYQQQFFSAIMRAPEQFSSAQFAVNFARQDDPERNLMTCTAAIRQEFRNDGDVVIPYEFYFGPNHFQTLKKMGCHYEKIIPLGGWLVGWFTQYAIIPMFNWFSRFFSSFGLIILLMTIVIKIVVFPLTYKSLSSSAKMSALKPEIEKINAKYPHADNQQEQLKKQQATMDLYKRAGASPMGGCLPTLLTFPILWAMFRFFPASIELRQQPFLWCHDLSAYDSILDYGVHIPILGDHLSLFALLMAVTMWLYSKMTMNSQPSANDPSAASMKFVTLWMMPIMMFFICNNLSAALSYYYLLSQLISMLQTWIVRKSINPDDILEKVRKSEGKPLPKSKWQQRLEEAQKMQEQQMKQQAKNRR
ncbi:MAG: membrane protein insertase YidC [Bacteroidales bacterium]|nr:membrane protein insertase YidC [Bacteroidales bacterium]